MGHLREVVVQGQSESCMEFNVVEDRNGDGRFVACTITGPENALCMRLNKRTVRQMRRTLELLEREL